MNDPLESYALTLHVHDSFLANNSLLTKDEIAASGVTLAGGVPSENKTERLQINGLIEGRPAYQSLAKDMFGTFHLSTVFTDYGGKHIQHDIQFDSPLEQAQVMTCSLFMRALLSRVYPNNM